LKELQKSVHGTWPEGRFKCYLCEYSVDHKSSFWDKHVPLVIHTTNVRIAKAQGRTITETYYDITMTDPIVAVTSSDTDSETDSDEPIARPEPPPERDMRSLSRMTEDMPIRPRSDPDSEEDVPIKSESEEEEEIVPIVYEPGMRRSVRQLGVPRPDYREPSITPLRHSSSSSSEESERGEGPDPGAFSQSPDPPLSRSPDPSPEREVSETPLTRRVRGLRSETREEYAERMAELSEEEDLLPPRFPELPDSDPDDPEPYYGPPAGGRLIKRVVKDYQESSGGDILMVFGVALAFLVASSYA